MGAIKPPCLDKSKTVSQNFWKLQILFHLFHPLLADGFSPGNMMFYLDGFTGQLSFARKPDA